MAIRIIESKQNPRVKELRATLLRPGRGDADSIALEGMHLVVEALRSGVELTTVFISQGHENLLRELNLDDSTEVLALPSEVLSSAVTELIPTTKRIILDLSDLKHTDSMGLGTLVRLYVSAKSAGCSLELMHLSQQVRNLLGLTNMLQIFTVVGEHGIKFM